VALGIVQGEERIGERGTNDGRDTPKTASLADYRARRRGAS
jgi:hypothetical protein